MTAPQADFSVGPATERDRTAVLDLLREAALPREGLEAAGIDLLVAVDRDGALLGSAAVETHGPSGLLRSVATRDDARGRGVGSRLVGACIERARQRGLSELYLLTETAAGWFPRFGFRRVPRDSAPDALQRSPEFASLCPSSAVCMRRELAAAGRPH